jgi:hypothetical protein
VSRGASMGRAGAVTERTDHGFVGGAPGASAPGEPGYEGEATIGDEGARAGPESFLDPDTDPAEEDAAIPPEVRERWAGADAKTADHRPGDESG